MPTKKQLADEIRAAHLNLYGTQANDDEVLNDFRRRAAGLGYDQQKVDKNLETITDYKKPWTLPNPMGLTTAVKSGVNAAALGLPEWGAQLGGTSLFNPGEREEHTAADLGGNVIGSVLGFGKIAKMAKGAKMGYDAIKAMAIADAVAGAGAGAAYEHADQMNERRTNASGVNRGDTTWSVPMAAAGGALGNVALPMVQMRALKNAIEPSMLKKVVAGIGAPIAGNMLAQGGAALAEHPEETRWDEFATQALNPLSLGFPLAMGAHGLDQLSGGRRSTQLSNFGKKQLNRVLPEKLKMAQSELPPKISYTGAETNPDAAGSTGATNEDPMGLGIDPDAAAATSAVGAEDTRASARAVPDPEAARPRLPNATPEQQARHKAYLDRRRNPEVHGQLSDLMVSQKLKKHKRDIDRTLSDTYAANPRAVTLELDVEGKNGPETHTSSIIQKMHGGRTGYIIDKAEGQVRRHVVPELVKDMRVYIQGYDDAGHMDPKLMHQQSLRELEEGPDAIEDAAGNLTHIILGYANPPTTGTPLIWGLDRSTGVVRELTAADMPTEDAANAFNKLVVNKELRAGARAGLKQREPRVGKPKIQDLPASTDIRSGIKQDASEIMRSIDFHIKNRFGDTPAGAPPPAGGPRPGPTGAATKPPGAAQIPLDEDQLIDELRRRGIDENIINTSSKEEMLEVLAMINKARAKGEA